LPLFEQIGKQIHLTDAGCELLQYSRSILQQLKEMDALFSEMKGLEHGRLDISVVSTANYFMPQLLVKFIHLHPKIKVGLHVANRDAVLKQLADNSTDLAILGQPPDGLDISAESFLDNPLVVIAAPTHPLAKLKRVKFASLATETFLSREQGSGTRSAMERVFAQHKIQPHISMEMETNEAIKQAAGHPVVAQHRTGTGNQTARHTQCRTLSAAAPLVRRASQQQTPFQRGFGIQGILADRSEENNSSTLKHHAHHRRAR